jgi:hypothetical protein
MFGNVAQSLSQGSSATTRYSRASGLSTTMLNWLYSQYLSLQEASRLTEWQICSQVQTCLYWSRVHVIACYPNVKEGPLPFILLYRHDSIQVQLLTVTAGNTICCCGDKTGSLTLQVCKTTTWHNFEPLQLLHVLTNYLSNTHFGYICSLKWPLPVHGPHIVSQMHPLT